MLPLAAPARPKVTTAWLSSQGRAVKNIDDIRFKELLFDFCDTRSNAISRYRAREKDNKAVPACDAFSLKSGRINDKGKQLSALYG
jgi:hypothetical protein